MRFPWTKRQNRAKTQTEQAKNEYEWAVQNRSTVSSLVERLVFHGQENAIIEKLTQITRGGHR